MIKKISVFFDNFFYRVLIKNLLKLSKLGYGFVVTGAESGVNYEHIYDNKSVGDYLIGKYIDRTLLNLPAVQATRNRKDEIKYILWNEIENNIVLKKKTKILDIASGGARYLRELASQHNEGNVESVCLDKDQKCVTLGRELTKREGISNLRFFKGNAFQLDKLKSFSVKNGWKPNVITASGFFIYFNNEVVEKMIREISDYLPTNGCLIFTSYEKLNTRKLMRKSMATSSGEEWVLYYRKPEYWRELLLKSGFKQVFIVRDKWQMNNVCYAKK